MDHVCIGYNVMNWPPEPH